MPHPGKQLPQHLGRRLERVLSLNDLEVAAKRFLPRPVFGYVSGGVEDDRSLDDNRAAFAEQGLVPRVLRDVSQRSQAVTLFGRTYDSPFGIAPMGLTALSAYRGDIAQAAAARALNIPMILSGSSLVALEDVAAVAPETWFQAYLPGNPQRADALLDRVAAAGYRTLVLTVDIPVGANRENNVRNGFSTPLRPGPRLAYDGLVRPRWLFGTFLRTLLRHGMPHFENSFAERGAPILSPNVLRDFTGRDHLNWQHVDRVRRRWKGELVVKGVLSVEDAAIARDRGADGIIVSNHGGRQLDGALAPLRVLPEIVAALTGFPVMIDGGIRRGTDVLKALSLGAAFVFVGRPFTYAAAIGGQPGVEHAIRLLRDEIDRDMAMLGANRCADLHPGLLRRLSAGTHAALMGAPAVPEPFRTKASTSFPA